MLVLVRSAGKNASHMGSVNIFTVEIPEGRLDVASAVGSGAYAMFLYELPDGESSCPYHYEYEEEWLLVLEGSVVLRTPDGESTLARGDLACFQPGPAGAHKLTNRSGSSARMMMFSGSRLPAVSVYPDSDKIGVWSSEDADSLVFERGTAVPWAQGEEGFE